MKGLLACAIFFQVIIFGIIFFGLMAETTPPFKIEIPWLTVIWLQLFVVSLLLLGLGVKISEAIVAKS